MVAEKAAKKKAAPKKSGGKPSVTVYSAVWCPWCKKAKEWLTENKVSFKEIDVEKDPKAAEDMVKRSGQTGITGIEEFSELKTVYIDYSGRLQRAQIEPYTKKKTGKIR